MKNQASNPESGLRNHRVEFVRESSVGETPTDPSWNLFSDNLDTALVWTGDAQVEALRGVGDVDPQAHFQGPEDHSASISYHLQQFFVDGSGNPLDAAGDALLRDSSNDIPNTHTVVDRGDHGSFRTYTVLRGAYPNIDEVAGDPSSGLPVLVSLEYEARKGRSYRVNQPDDAGETLTISSTSANDTMDLELESDDGTTSETVTLNGTTDVTSTETYSSLDAFELSAEPEGNVTISDSGGNTLVTLYGTQEYDGVAGDTGVPALGSGSHASAYGSSYEQFLDDRVTRGGSNLAVEIRGSTFSVDNGYEKSGIVGGKAQAIHAGQREAEFTATVAGNYESHDAMDEHLRGTEADVVWEFDGGSVTFLNAVYSEAGEVGPESGDVISEVESTFVCQGIDVQSN